jgi:hypothetical protein
MPAPTGLKWRGDDPGHGATPTIINPGTTNTYHTKLPLMPRADVVFFRFDFRMGVTCTGDFTFHAVAVRERKKPD